jgi:hypothetical protein
MSFKHSLGYDPLESTSGDNSEFDYVGRDNPPNGRTDSIFDDYEAKSSFSLVDSFTEKMKALRAEAMQEEEKPEKKVASYYLEVETLKKLKEWADATKASYSSVVEQAIRSHLANTNA